MLQLRPGAKKKKKTRCSQINIKKRRKEVSNGLRWFHLSIPFLFSGSGKQTSLSETQLEKVRGREKEDDKWVAWKYWCFRTLCCRKWDPFQGPRMGSCLTLKNELSKETHALTKQEILLGRGTQAESSRVREPRRTALPRGLKSRVLWWWD